jgi:hypothetical protein
VREREREREGWPRSGRIASERAIEDGDDDEYECKPHPRFTVRFLSRSSPTSFRFPVPLLSSTATYIGISIALLYVSYYYMSHSVEIAWRNEKEDGCCPCLFPSFFK